MMSLTKELEDAVCSHDIEAVVEILRKGVDVNVPFENGISPLGKAILTGDDDIVHVIMDARSYLPDEPLRDDEHDSLSSESFDWNALRTLQEQATLYEENPSGNPNNQGIGLFHSLRRNTIRRNGCDVNLPDFRDRTPIYYAIECGNIDIIRELIQAGSRVNVSDSKNISPLHLAVRFGEVLVCEILLKAGSRVNCKTSDCKSSALHMACSRGSKTMVRLLLQYGANIESLDANDQTPLIVAIDRRYKQLVKLLLKRGAKINVEDIRGHSPLSLAVWNKDIVNVETLLDYGAKINNQHHLLHFAIIQKCKPLCELLITHGAFLNDFDECGFSPLCTAIKVKSLGILRFLLRSGCSVTNVSLHLGENAVHVIIDELDSELFPVFLDVLIRSGANLNQESSTTGDTPLFRSISCHKYYCVKELIRQGCNPNLGHVFSCRIDNLDILIQNKQFELVKLLVYAGYNLQNMGVTDILADAENKMIMSFLKNAKHVPMPLSKICRLAIRKHLGFGVVYKMCSLPLPVALKNFLIFIDDEISL